MDDPSSQPNCVRVDDGSATERPLVVIASRMDLYLADRAYKLPFDLFGYLANPCDQLMIEALHAQRYNESEIDKAARRKRAKVRAELNEIERKARAA